MYEPARVGPFALANPDLNLNLGWPTEWLTDFGGAASGITQCAPQFANGNINERHFHVTWQYSGTGVTLAAKSSMSFGVAVEGSSLNNQAMTYTLSSSVGVTHDKDGGCLVDTFFGRLNSATVSMDRNSSLNSVPSFAVLSCGSGGLSNCANSVQQVLGIGDEGQQFGTNPIIMGVRLLNVGSAVLSFSHIVVSTGLHKYQSAISSYEAGK